MRMVRALNTQMRTTHVYSVGSLAVFCAFLLPALTASAGSTQPPLLVTGAQEHRSPSASKPLVVAEEVAGDKAGNEKKDAESLPLPPASPPPEQTPAEQYCTNVLDAAAAAQLAQQKSKLEEAQKELDARVALISAKTEELKSWMKKREEFASRATDSLVQIYSKMKPDAAAAQLVAMDELVAAAIMSKLTPKVAGLIMTEMEAAKAARLSAVIAGAGEFAMKPEAKLDAQH